MKSLQLLVLSLIFFVSLKSVSLAQEPPIKWGVIPQADLEMKSYPADSNASALILCDYGESHLNDDLNIEFTRHLRIKILNEKGFEWGTHRFVLYTKDKSEYVTDIKGMTYNLDEKGTVIKSELDEDDIFDEKLNNNNTEYKFTLPSLKPGSVIEIKYTILSDSFWLMRDWIFQHSEPVRWSEYRMRIPKSILYAILTLGYEQYAVQEQEETTQIFSGAAQAFFHENIVNCNYYRWAVNNAPAIRDEPFISTLDDYKNRVIIQLSAFAYPGGVKEVLNDWPTLIKELLDHEKFGGMIDDTRTVKKLCEKITINCKTQKEKIETLHDWITQSVVCSKGDRLFADQEPDDVIETKKGSNADITFLFLSMMKWAGIQADPVILSTRDNGKVYDLYPMISQFNYVLSRVLVDSQYVLIAPTDRHRAMDLLPFDILNTRGLIIKDDAVKWTGITSNKTNKKMGQSRITVNQDGSINGMSEIKYFDYGSVFFRNKMKDKDPKEIATDVFDTEKYGFEIDSVSVTGLDSMNIDPYVKMFFHSSSYAQNTGDMIYMNPFLIERQSDNPLKMKTRKFPLDFGLKSQEKLLYTITIPDSFEIKEVPKSKLMSPGSSMSFDRKIQTEDKQIQIIDNFNINEIEVKPKNYDSVKYFFSRLVDAGSEQIVLQRKQPQEAAVKSGTGN